MKIYNIEKGELHTDLDTPYDKESNKIDVYCSVNWSGENEQDYEIKEQIINEYSYEDDLIIMSAWCDISGYNYWVIQQEESNYVSIDVMLKKQPQEYTQKEMESISNSIFTVNLYFEEELI